MNWIEGAMVIPCVQQRMGDAAVSEIDLWWLRMETRQRKMALLCPKGNVQAGFPVAGEKGFQHLEGELQMTFLKRS